MEDKRLKPCPFCGFDKHFVCTHRYGDIRELNYHVHCGRCGCLGGHDIKEDRAIELWNNRKV